MPKLDSNYLKGILRGFRLADTTINEAYTNLLEITSEERFSRELIGTYFQIWDMEKKEKEREEEHDRKDLSFAPDRVNKKITEYLDLQSRMNFRDSSAKIRPHVDISNFHINELIFTVDENNLEISTDKGTLRKYTNFNGNFIVEQGSNIRIVRNANFWSEVKNYLHNFLKWENLTIGTLQINGIPISNRDEAMKEFCLSLFPNGILLKVQTLKLINTCGRFIRNIIHFDSEYLKNLDLGQNYRRYESIDSKIFETEQWKKLETFTAGLVRSIGMPEFGQNFSHLNSCKLYLTNSISHMDLKRIHENLLLNPKLCQMIIVANTHLDDTRVMRDYMTFNSSSSERNIFHFDYPGEENAGKQLTFIKESMLLWFTGPEYIEERDKDDETIGTRDVRMNRLHPRRRRDDDDD